MAPHVTGLAFGQGLTGPVSHVPPTRSLLQSQSSTGCRLYLTSVGNTFLDAPEVRCGFWRGGSRGASLRGCLHGAGLVRTGFARRLWDVAESEPAALLVHTSELAVTVSNLGGHLRVAFLEWSSQGIFLSWNVLERPLTCTGKATEVSPFRPLRPPCRGERCMEAMETVEAQQGLRGGRAEAGPGATSGPGPARGRNNENEPRVNVPRVSTTSHGRRWKWVAEEMTGGRMRAHPGVSFTKARVRLGAVAAPRIAPAALSSPRLCRDRPSTGRTAYVSHQARPGPLPDPVLGADNRAESNRDASRPSGAAAATTKPSPSERLAGRREHGC